MTDSSSKAPTPEAVARLRSALQPVIEALQETLGDALVAIVLFGSRARGDQRADSDWDILVVAHELPEAGFQRHLQLKRALPDGWRGRVSLVARTPFEFESRVPALHLDIALDGAILYDRDDYMSEHLASLRRLITERGLRREQRGRELVWRAAHSVTESTSMSGPSGD